MKPDSMPDRIIVDFSHFRQPALRARRRVQSQKATAPDQPAVCAEETCATSAAGEEHPDGPCAIYLNC